MKKSVKKLTLCRETLRQLSGPGLRGVAGGYVTDAGFGGDCTNKTSQQNNCGSAFCGSVSCDVSCICDTSNGLINCIPG